ncbi:MAG: ABC transporter substrate-binding protein [Pseudomonadota bacterium]
MISVRLLLVCTIVALGQGVALRAEVSLLTGSGHPPFTDAAWPQRGMITELIETAFAESPEPEPFRLIWRDDWDRHLDLIRNQTVDMAFPWFQPLCDAPQINDPRCVDFHFSDPVIDLVILLFVRADNEFAFTNDADLAGRTLCRPAGVFTQGRAEHDQPWRKIESVTLRQPADPTACFEMLMSGDVDAVAVNEFLGVRQLFEAQLTEDVVPLSRPLSTQSLHVVISKTHWRGTSLMYRFNAGLAKLRESGAYAEIVSRHLATYWARLKG